MKSFYQFVRVLLAFNLILSVLLLHFTRAKMYANFWHSRDATWRLWLPRMASTGQSSVNSHLAEKSENKMTKKREGRKGNGNDHSRDHYLFPLSRQIDWRRFTFMHFNLIFLFFTTIFKSQLSENWKLHHTFMNFQFQKKKTVKKISFEFSNFKKQTRYFNEENKTS